MGPISGSRIIDHVCVTFVCLSATKFYSWPSLHGATWSPPDPDGLHPTATTTDGPAGRRLSHPGAHVSTAPTCRRAGGPQPPPTQAARQVVGATCGPPPAAHHPCARQGLPAQHQARRPLRTSRGLVFVGRGFGPTASPTLDRYDQRRNQRLLGAPGPLRSLKMGTNTTRRGLPLTRRDGHPGARGPLPRRPPGHSGVRRGHASPAQRAARMSPIMPRVRSLTARRGGRPPQGSHGGASSRARAACTGLPSHRDDLHNEEQRIDVLPGPPVHVVTRLDGPLARRLSFASHSTASQPGLGRPSPRLPRGSLP